MIAGLDIIIDIDDVLIPWSHRAHAECEQAGITNGQQITQWEFWRDYGCTPEELWDVLHNAYYNGMLLTPPFPEAQPALQRLHAAGHRGHLVTARGFEAGEMAAFVRQCTAAWVDDNWLEHSSLTFTRDKRIIRGDVALDDSPKNVTALEAAGVTTYLADAIHNQGFHHPRRVSGIAEFTDIILSREEAAA